MFSISQDVENERDVQQSKKIHTDSLRWLQQSHIYVLDTPKYVCT